jgi:hypothetical protein
MPGPDNRTRAGPARRGLATQPGQTAGHGRAPARPGSGGPAIRPAPSSQVGDTPVQAVTLLASPWSALHRTRDRIEAATFGTFDGATSSYG